MCSGYRVQGLGFECRVLALHFGPADPRNDPREHGIQLELVVEEFAWSRVEG